MNIYITVKPNAATKIYRIPDSNYKSKLIIMNRLRSYIHYHYTESLSLLNLTESYANEHTSRHPLLNPPPLVLKLIGTMIDPARTHALNRAAGCRFLFCLSLHWCLWCHVILQQPTCLSPSHGRAVPSLCLRFVIPPLFLPSYWCMESP